MQEKKSHVTMFLAMIVVAGYACQFLSEATDCTCSIYKPRAIGAAVVRDVLDGIKGLGIFPDDKNFLCRVAWVESKYGEDDNTFRKGYHGGIWQVDEIAYNETVKQQGLKKYRDLIKEKLGIDWTKTTWKDLEKPLYSALAARLYFLRIRDAIPCDLQPQAQYWKTHYNTEAGSGTVKKFIDDVEAGCPK